VMILVYLGGARNISALTPKGQSLASPTVVVFASTGFACLLIRRQLGSLFGVWLLVVCKRGRLAPDFVALRPKLLEHL
jgi:hypothetical protein